MMTSELRNLLKINSNNEACSDQASLCACLAELQAVADDLNLDFAGAYREAEARHQSSEPANFDPCI
jgi:hypothetical protein